MEHRNNSSSVHQAAEAAEEYLRQLFRQPVEIVGRGNHQADGCHTGYRLPIQTLTARPPLRIEITTRPIPPEQTAPSAT